MADVRTAPKRAALALAAMLALGMTFTGFSGAIAQDDAPSAPAPRPGHIHEGSCADLGGVIFPLTTATLNGVSVEELEAPGDVTGNSAGGIPVAASATMGIDASLETILSADHAINFHESDENIATYIACGNLSGIVVNDTLHVGLAELDNSGYTGIAILTDNGDETTNVVVYLSPVNADADGGDATPDAGMGDMDMDASPEADMGDMDMSDGEMVGMAGLTFAPDSLTVAAGTTVTFMNDDSVAHTVTAEDGSFDSGNINAGETFEYTFDEPGTYEYVCIYHGGMSGTIVVE